MTFIRKLLLLFVLLNYLSQVCYAVDDRPNWMDSTLTGLNSIFSRCRPTPTFDGIRRSEVNINLEDDGVWQPTGIRVAKDKSLRLKWNLQGVILLPAKYLAMIRIDPRFKVLQVFLQKYHYDTNKYISDFHTVDNGILLQYQNDKVLSLVTRFPIFTDYFNFKIRDSIPIKQGDIVDMSIIESNEFFGSGSQFSNEYESPVENSDVEPSLIYTTSSELDNKIVFSDVSSWCQFQLDTGFDKCLNYGVSTTRVKDSKSLSVGSPVGINTAIPNCLGSNSACYQDKGTGFGVRINAAKEILPTDPITITNGGKNISDEFIEHNGKYVMRFEAKKDGYLRFFSELETHGRSFNLFDQYMYEWPSILYTELVDYFNSAGDLVTNKISYGRYFLKFEIGPKDGMITDSQLDKINMYFYIQEDGQPAPDSSVAGIKTGIQAKTTAPADGYLWVKIEKPFAELGGTINVDIANYTGRAWFSEVIYESLIKPLREKYNEISKLVFDKFVTNPTFQGIARTCLTLYVCFYGLFFLAGFVQVSLQDIIIRSIKISIIVALISPGSWNFFNDNLFEFFVEGSDYLISKVTGLVSTNENIFGFIDPIFNKYTDPDLWFLLFVQLLQFYNGLTFFAIITIYSILIYFRALLEVIISYCIAFLALAILISLAPLFLIFMLFERTRGMFEAWISSLLHYMLQPTILLIFFLLIDQLISRQLSNIVVGACWGTYIPIHISIDLNHIGLPFSFSFQLPFLEGIPFYISQVVSVVDIFGLFGTSNNFYSLASGVFLFYLYCKLAAGLTEYVNIVIQMLTNVQADRIDGELQKGSGLAGQIADNIRSLGAPVTNAIKGTGKFAKSRLIDQKFTKRNRFSGPGIVNYDAVQEASSNSRSGLTSEFESGRIGAEDSIGTQKSRSETSGTSSSLGGPLSTSASGVGSFGSGQGRRKEVNSGDLIQNSNNSQEPVRSKTELNNQEKNQNTLNRQNLSAGPESSMSNHDESNTNNSDERSLSDERPKNENSGKNDITTEKTESTSAENIDNEDKLGNSSRMNQVKGDSGGYDASAGRGNFSKNQKDQRDNQEKNHGESHEEDQNQSKSNQAQAGDQPDDKEGDK